MIEMTSGVKTKPKHKDESNDLTVQKDYVSRRTKVFEDSQSEDEDYVQTEGSKPPETGIIQYQDTKGNITSLKPNIRFLPYQEMFTNLMKQTSVVTMFPILSMLITYDSTKALTVTKEDDRNYYIKMYDLEEYALTFEEKIGGGPNSYIKFKLVEQNSTGKQFAALYNDDGIWHLRTFGKKSRS